MTTNSFLRRGAVAPVIALTLAACSGGDSTPAATDATTAALGDTTDTEPADDTAEAAEPAAATTPASDPPTETTPTETTSAETTPTDTTPTETTEATGSGEVLTDIVADATGGRSQFDGSVDDIADLEALVADAWGDGGLGIHRGHAQIENVLEAFLGIDHDTMHVYMDDGFNLAALSVELGRQPEALVETLTNSYAPYVIAGVDAGVITEAEAADWIDRIRTEFANRVFWEG